MKSSTFLLALLAAIALACARTPAVELQPDPFEGRTAKMLAIAMPLRHLSREPVDDNISTNALDIFLSSLDYEHVYFLQSDIESFEKSATELDDQIRAGDLDFAFQVYNIYKTRMANRVAYVKELLEKGFDVTRDEQYQWKRKDAPWPADEEAWNELWRLKIKNEYVTRLVAKQLGSEEPTALEAANEDGATATNEVEAADAKLTPEQQIEKNYARLLTIVQDNDANWLTERYLNAFTHAYDPHSDYMSPSGAEDFEISMKLSLEGIGALLTSEDGAAKVERLIPGGPAERDGRLKPNDKIIAVAQGDSIPVDVLHWTLQKTVRLIRGEKGTKVVLSVIPASDSTGSTIEKIDLIRDEVKLEEQAAKSEMRTLTGADGIERKVGVITLPEFYAPMKGGGESDPEGRSSSRDVAALLDQLRDQGAEGIVLDLRNNGGGSLSDAIQMTGLFVESGPVVQVKDQRRVHTLSDPNPDVSYTGPVIVLVNRLSASASEILAGALQDYGRAIIIGDSKTHGKGTVQTLTYLNAANTNMGSLKVTTASFYRIAGGSTQMRGIEPDIVIPSPFDAMDVGEDQLPHAMPWSRVEAAFYDRTADLRGVVPELKTRSEQRRGNDPKFNTYTNLLARLAERQQSKSVSLNLDTRLQLAQSEKDLQKQLDENDPSKSRDEKKQNDLVLGESLKIMCDWLSLRENEKAIGTAAHPGHPS